MFVEGADRRVQSEEVPCSTERFVFVCVSPDLLLSVVCRISAQSYFERLHVELLYYTPEIMSALKLVRYSVEVEGVS